jgi:uncharacterized protein YyaL (SSP411 family)
MPNSLILEDSPYLLQHANNPVNWFAWCDKAFEKAINEQKPIFLSIGYSSCHWCHVMENEVFENESIAKILNEHFVCIKVDKEERPDIDKYYQNLYQIMKQKGGGWPLSMFLTHDKKPFYTATYIPPQNFSQLCLEINELYDFDYSGIAMRSEELEKFAELRYINSQTLSFGANFADFLEEKLQKNFDSIYGGFGNAPKFPHTAILNLCMKIYKIKKSPKIYEIISKTLKQMAKGGLRDIVDGGFCRYSTDDIWLVPHFEKMTYDNALLCENYINFFEISDDRFFIDIAKEIAEFMLDKMYEKGLFYTASDADSLDENGKTAEGAYFVYDFEELQYGLAEVFGAKRTIEIMSILGVNRSGNFDGKNILRNDSLTPLSSELKSILKMIRSSKNYPFVDKKCIVSWNAMMIKSLFLLSKYEPKYLKTAVASLEALCDKAFINDILYHSFLIGGKDAVIEGFLEDYAYLADTLFFAYQTTLHEKYMDLCIKICYQVTQKFVNDGKWSFSVGEFETDGDIFDSSYPSSVAIMCRIFYIVGTIKEPILLDIAIKTIEYYSSFIANGSTSTAVFSEVVLMDVLGVKIFKSNLANILKDKKENKEPFVFYYKTNEASVEICSKYSCSA